MTSTFGSLKESNPITARQRILRTSFTMKPIIKPYTKLTLIVAVLTFARANIPAQIQATSSGQVTVNRTTIDYVLNKITIVGVNFGSTTPSVTLQSVPLTVQSFNSGTGTIVAMLPNALNPGSYLLAVTTIAGGAP